MMVAVSSCHGCWILLCPILLSQLSLCSHVLGCCRFRSFFWAPVPDINVPAGALAAPAQEAFTCITRTFMPTMKQD
jgi:hypothetical protein